MTMATPTESDVVEMELRLPAESHKNLDEGAEIAGVDTSVVINVVLAFEVMYARRRAERVDPEQAASEGAEP